MIMRSLFAATLLGAACLPFSVCAAAEKTPGIEELLSRVPLGAAWHDLPRDLQRQLEMRASSILARDRSDWGLPGLQKKEKLLLSVPTTAMIENLNRILSIVYASVLPDGFDLSRDVQNLDLKRALIRLYLAQTDERGNMLFNHPEFRGWDGLPVKELHLLDHEHVATMSDWHGQIEKELNIIPRETLTALEIDLRAKTYFLTRAGKHFRRPAIGLTGSFGYANFYVFPKEQRPFLDDEALLDAYNASMFTEFREVNKGTVDAFVLDHTTEFNRAHLEKQGMPTGLVDNVLKLGVLFRTRVEALPAASAKCTIFTRSDRNATWDAFTATQRSNADGRETMESYAHLYEETTSRRAHRMRSIGKLTFERLFPPSDSELTPEQRSQITDRLMREKRPAMMINTLITALDAVTGTTLASKTVHAALEGQLTVGGGYSPGQAVRDVDRTRIDDVWDKIRAYIKREYSGYRIDIAALIPDKPNLVTTGQMAFSLGGHVTLALEAPENLASLSSTMMHEIKHAIDQNSRGAVEGAAWEGAATSVERQVWPLFIEEALAGQESLLAMALLKTEVDNVRFTATTDATLKIFLRESCAGNEPDTITFAKQVVQNYGYEDAAVLQLRSQRAHASSQYLQYDYGLTMYSQLLSYLQGGIGPEPRVDAFLLQACGMPSPKAEQASIDNLKACIRQRKR